MFCGRILLSFDNRDTQSAVSPVSETEAVGTLLSWFQEHTVLCNAAVSENQWTPEVQQRWKDCLAESAQKGQVIMASLPAEKAKQMLLKFMPVAGSVRGKSPIPLSGFRRFDEQPAQTRGQMGGLNLSGSSQLTVMSPSNAPVNVLQPSRTYLKKSGN